MKSLKDWNNAAYAKRDEHKQSHPNNIACPSCSAELKDSNPDIILTSNPPQLAVHCSSCGYKGYRYI